MQIVVSGYNRLDSRTIIIKKYASGNFTKALDSATFVYTGKEATVFGKKDTLYFKDYSTTSATLKNVYIGYDWDISLPSVRENYRITGIRDIEHRYEMARCGDDDASCINDIGQYVCNGTWAKGNQLLIEKKTK